MYASELILFILHFHIEKCNFFQMYQQNPGNSIMGGGGQLPPPPPGPGNAIVVLLITQFVERKHKLVVL